MSRPGPNLEDPRAIAMVLQRLCRDGVAVDLQVGPHAGAFRIQAVGRSFLHLALPGVVRGQWGLGRGGHAAARLVDRGRAYEAVLDLDGTEAWNGEESCRFDLPRTLRALDPHRLADFVPDHPVPCLFTSSHSDVVEARATAFGLEGLEAAPQGGGDPARMLLLGHTTTLELRFEAGHLTLPAKVQYLTPDRAGFLFDQPPRELLARYQAWLFDAERDQARKDLEVFDEAGVQARPERTEHGPHPGGRLTLLSPRDPMVLVVAEGEGLARRLADSLGRKYGVAALDYVQGHLRPLLEPLGAGPGTWGRTRLMLIHQRLRVTSGLAFAHEVAQAEACPLPVLLAGTAEDADLKRNRAIAAGAVDFLVVEPFSAVRTLQAVEGLLRMFP